jgi:type IV secretory pathway TrbL component
MTWLELYRLVEIINGSVASIFVLYALIAARKKRREAILLTWANRLMHNKVSIYLVLLAFLIMFAGAILDLIGETYLAYLFWILEYLVLTYTITLWAKWITALS